MPAGYCACRAFLCGGLVCCGILLWATVGFLALVNPQIRSPGQPSLMDLPFLLRNGFSLTGG